jgi:alpha-galactosidase
MAATVTKATVGASLALIALAFLPFLSSRQFPADPQQIYATAAKLEVKRASADFLPDGDLSKPSWKRAQWTKFDREAYGNRRFPELSTRVASLWTEKYIYFAFSTRYDSLNVYQAEDPAVERWKLWERDVVEVFLNPQPGRIHHYYEFEVAPNNQWIDLEIDKTKTPFNDASWNSGFEHATRIDAHRRIWTTEMRIPLSSMNATAIYPGAQWRANFFRVSGKSSEDSAGTHRKFLSWSHIPDAKSFHTPTRFAILQFAN